MSSSGAGAGAGAGAAAESAATAGADTVAAATATAEQCLAWDPNAALRAETQAMLDAGDGDAIVAAFGTRIAFGTAGLRGPMGCGIANMNDLTILQATQGMCKYLEDTVDGCKERGVAIGYDHRRTDAVSSRSFALLAAAVLLSRGFKVFLFRDIVCTPLVPFTLNKRGCAAGIVVTASHNPKEDNGFKVYWENGAMIIPPVDAGITQSILANLAPWQTYDYSADAVFGHERCLEQRDELGAAYIDTIAARLCRYRDANAASTAPIAYTAMHGVGQEWVMRVFEAFGHAAPIPTPKQAEPDPTFPTVAYPNPEEGKGALALAIETAKAAGAALILANDPDADRLAVAEIQADGSCRVFKGDEIGLLLGSWEWQCWRKANPDANPTDVVMLASTVSSKVLSGMARKEGFLFEDTLTGHKWLGNRAVQLRAAGKQVLFAYEEAIGFCIGDVVKDKDGVSAAAVFAELYKSLHAEGRTVAEHLESLYTRYGYFVSNNGYLFTPDSATIDTIFERLRNGGKYWLRCGGFAIADVRDLEEPGVDTSKADEVPTMPVSSSHMITYYFRNGCVATIRPSGTEPKIKYYIEMPGSNPEEASAVLERVAAAVVEEMLQPEANGLFRKKA